MNVKWRVKEHLDRHGKTPYALWKASGLSRTTVYAITQGTPDRVDLETLNKLLSGLERLTGERAELTDVLEVIRGEAA
jgi:DNA-binding Xre family transcriptional regulator